MFSAQLFRIFGQEPSEDGVPRFDWRAMVKLADRPALDAVLARGPEATENGRLGFRIVRPNGIERHLAAQLFAVEQGVAAVVEDATDRLVLKQMQEEFLSMAAHELRTPLTAIVAPLQMVLHGMVDPTSSAAQDMLALALRSAERLARHVDASQLLARLQRGQAPSRLGHCDARDVVDGALETVSQQLHDTQVTLEVLNSGVPLPLRADRDQLQQVVEQLVLNAVAASPRGGSVCVRVQGTGDVTRIEVLDRGHGVPPALREAIFEPFRQADMSSTRRMPGLGLGLSIARRLVEQQAGRLLLEDRAGGGSAFVVELPRAEGASTPLYRGGA